MTAREPQISFAVARAAGIVPTLLTPRNQRPVVERIPVQKVPVTPSRGAEASVFELPDHCSNVFTAADESTYCYILSGRSPLHENKSPVSSDCLPFFIGVTLVKQNRGLVYLVLSDNRLG